MIAVALASACIHRTPATISGDALYAQVGALRTQGHVQIDGITVRTDQFLVSPDRAQVFPVGDAIAHCEGGAPEADVSCTLVLLRSQRFRVLDRLPKPSDPPGEDSRALSPRGRWIAGTLIAAAPLTAGVVICDFPGCRAVFGVPLAIDVLVLALVALVP